MNHALAEIERIFDEALERGRAQTIANGAVKLRDILDDLLDAVGQVCDDIGDYKLDDPLDIAHVLHDAIAKARGRL